MKKIIRLTALTLALFAIAACIAGCALLEPEDKVFTAEELSITLNDGFAEQDLITQTAYYVSKDAIVTALKEPTAGIAGAPKNVKEYAELVCTVNSLTESAITEKADYASFTYEKEVNGKDFFYYARCYQNGSDFWLVQFACETKNKDAFTETFGKWADSINFTTTDKSSL